MSFIAKRMATKFYDNPRMFLDDANCLNMTAMAEWWADDPDEEVFEAALEVQDYLLEKRLINQ